MNRTRNLLILLCILAIVSAGSYAVEKLNSQDTAPEPRSAADSFCSIEPSEVISLSLTTDESMLFEKDGNTWHYPQDMSFPVNPYLLEQMLTELSSLSITRSISMHESAEEYGLDKPLCSIEISDGENTFLARIGAETELGGERYLSTGDDRLYLVDASVLDSFNYRLFDLAKKEVLPNMSNTLSFSVTSGEKSYELDYIENSGLAYSDDYVWFLKDGDDYLTLDTALTESFVGRVRGLIWGELVNYKASDSQLKEYGLASPLATVRIDYLETSEAATNAVDSEGNTIYESRETERSFRIEFGKYVDDNCYARISGSQMVYLVPGNICDELLHASYEDLQPDEVLSMDWSTVERIDLELGGGVYSFEKSPASADPAAPVWLLDGEETSLQTVLDYIELIIPSNSGAEKKPELGRQISFTFHRSSVNFKTVELIIYDYDSTDCLVSLDGVCRLLISREDLSHIINDIYAII